MRYGTPQRLAAGATSVVYEMVPPVRHVTKAIACGHDATRLRAALYELRVMRRLVGCPRAVQLADAEVLSRDGAFTVCLVEERCGSLSDVLARQAPAAPACVDIALGVTDALIACREAGVFHLDVQPKNVFVADDGRILLGDFGHSLFTEDLGDRSRLRGTLAFMAPEVFHSRQYGERSDIYSVGILLWCLLSGGSLPFAGECPASEAAYRLLAGEPLPELMRLGARQRAAAGEALREVCAFDRELRPATFEQLRGRLARLRQELEELGEPGEQRGALDAFGFHAESGPLGGGGESWSWGSVETVTAAPWPRDAQPPLWPVPPAGDGQPAGARQGWDAPGSSVPAGFFDADAEALSVALTSEGLGAAWGRPSVPQVPSAPAVSFAVPAPAAPAAPAPAPTPPAPPAPAPPLQLEGVRFSVLAPQHMERDEYATIDMYLYEQGFRDIVDQMKAESFTQVQERQAGFLQVERQSTVRVVLSSPHAGIEEDAQELTWLGGFLVFSFDVHIPEGYGRNSIPFRAVVYVNGVQATRLSFTVQCSAAQPQQPEVIRSDIHSAFISYSSDDRDRVVSLIQGMRAARPDLDIFFDVQSLRVGQDWKPALMREVESRDVLYLCWSRAARASEYVDLEWRHALETKGIEFIEPIPLEPPTVCPPPEELKAKHFNDILLFLLGS